MMSLKKPRRPLFLLACSALLGLSMGCEPAELSPDGLMRELLKQGISIED